VNDDDLCVCAVCRKPSSIYDCLIVDSPDGEVRVDLVCIKRLWSAACTVLSEGGCTMPLTPSQRAALYDWRDRTYGCAWVIATVLALASLGVGAWHVAGWLWRLVAH
jgi:hypothetical protein